MGNKSKEQAGAELLEAIDAYIDAVMTERSVEIRQKRIEQNLKYVEEHKNEPFHIPEDSRGPYAQSLRKSMEFS